jgi:HSP20 family molecular chaperone IbpA
MATKIAATKHYPEVTIGNLLAEVQRAMDSICQRAYEFAAERGFATGHDLDDWLKAESELFFVPASELTETATEYILNASVAGFKPDQITVSAEPQCVTVWGKAPASRGNLPEEEAEPEAGTRELFCQYRLPHAVVVERVKAIYDSGRLTVTLPKQSEPVEADMEQPAAA